MFSFRGKSNPYMLIVGMTGVKMGDHLLQIGCTDAGALAAIAAKVGLSGRAVAVVPDIETAVKSRKGAERQGVLVEVEVGPATALPAADADFDLVVVDDARGDFAKAAAATQATIVGEGLRILKPGGRLLVIGAGPREGLAAMFGGNAGPVFDAEPALKSGGCRLVRLLAEKEGLRFVEGTKART